MHLLRSALGVGLDFTTVVACAQAAAPTSGSAFEPSLIDTQHEVPSMPPATAKHAVTETFFGNVVHDPRMHEGHGVTASFSQRVGNTAAALAFFAEALGLPNALESAR